MFDLIYDPNAWAALVTLTALEIVLGIDNIVFISVLVSRCEPQDAKRARQIGLALALIFRILLLLALTWLMRLTYPVFSVFGRDFSWHDIILIVRRPVPDRQGDARDPCRGRGRGSGGRRRQGARRCSPSIVLQIVAVDLVFSVDSIVTAIGMAQDIEIMIVAVVIADDRDVCGVRPGRALHRAPSDHEDAGARLPGDDRRRAGGGRI